MVDQVNIFVSKIFKSLRFYCVSGVFSLVFNCFVVVKTVGGESTKENARYHSERGASAGESRQAGIIFFTIHNKTFFYIFLTCILSHFLKFIFSFPT